MQVLLDTHILIWFLEGNNLLSNNHCQIIVNPANEVFISIASLWEMAIKISLGKLTLAKPPANVIRQLQKENIGILPILPNHTLQILSMPFHHKDPFDRIIIAQSQIEKLTIITNDRIFSEYLVNLA